LLKRKPRKPEWTDPFAMKIATVGNAVSLVISEQRQKSKLALRVSE